MINSYGERKGVGEEGELQVGKRSSLGGGMGRRERRVDKYVVERV